MLTCEGRALEALGQIWTGLANFVGIFSGPQKLWVFRCFSHQTLVVPVHKTNSGIDRNSSKTDFLHPWFSIVPKSRGFCASLCNFPPEHQDPWLRTWDMFAGWNLRMRYTQNGKDQRFYLLGMLIDNLNFAWPSRTHVISCDSPVDSGPYPWTNQNLYWWDFSHTPSWYSLWRFPTLDDFLPMNMF